MAPPAIGGVSHPCPAPTGGTADHGAPGGRPDQPRPAARQHQPQLQSPRYEGHCQNLEVSPRLRLQECEVCPMLSQKTWSGVLC